MTNQEQYKQKVIDALKAFQKAHQTLTELWMNDNKNDIDLNDFLSKDFPFEGSFDDYHVKLWVDNSIIRLTTTPMYSVDNSEPITFETFYKINTGVDVEPLAEQEFKQIRNLKVGEVWNSGLTASVKRTK